MACRRTGQFTRSGFIGGIIPFITEIYVRGRIHEFSGEKIRYLEVVDLGYPNGHGPDYEYDVTGRMVPKKTRAASRKVSLYDVYFTDKS